MAEDSYKNDMRRLIDIAKTMSFSSPLHSTLEDLKLLTTASKDLSDRIEMRVRNSLMKDDDKAKAKPKVQSAKPYTSMKTAKKVSFKPIPKLKTPTAKSNNIDNDAVRQVPTSNANDLVTKQSKLQAIKPQPPISSF